MKTLLILIISLLFSVTAYAQQVVIDVRTPAEYAEKHIAGAHNIDYTNIEKEIGSLKLAKDEKIILYCRSGRRSGIALETLKKLGFSNVENYGGYEQAQARLTPKSAPSN